MIPKPFKKALAAYEAGDLAKTESHCRTALKSNPDFFDALHLLAIVQSRAGRHVAALDSFNKAVRLSPNDAEVINNRASALTEAKRYEEALSGYDRALQIRPDYADAHNNRGCLLMEMQRYDDALVNYGKALVLEPDNAEFTNNLGRALTRLRHYADALACYDDALSLRPNYVEALINRGVTLSELKRFDEALACFDKASTHAADHVDVLLNRGKALSGLERFTEALVVYDRLRALHPNNLNALLSRGFVLTKLRRFEEAFANYDDALALKFDPADALIGRAMTFMEMGRTEEAIAVIDRTLSMRPDHPEAHNARGLIAMNAERLPEAITSLRRAVDLRGEYPEAAWNLGCLLLLSGHFPEGWRHYEARRVQKGTTWTILKGPEWRGEPLAGKRLLLYAEQGHGDVLQFVRFVRVATRMGARVLLGIHSPLAALLSMMDESPIIVRHGEVPPAYDYHAPIMSMPFILGLDEKEIPSDVPYLRADESRIATWQSKLPQSTFRVGIAWQGSKVDPARWIPLTAFAPLSRVPGVTLISLQKTDGLEQLADLPPGMTIETLGPDFDAGPGAFLDTAAVIMNLDLVVSIDTAIAHLAGALGCRVWIALKHHPEWRWMLETSVSPWYPTARLFRQRRKSEWTQVMEEIAIELAQLVERPSM